jgi:hypothetical protein
MQTALWKKVLAHDFDRPLTSFGFSTRVARENFWTRNFTSKAIIEYKKFMYLAATSDMMVSPSPIIDKVWHEHLMFSKSYREFCQVLGKDIQHVPSTHNREDFEKFRLAKERTQKLYTSVFGEQPEDIWNNSSMYDSLSLPKANINLRTFINYGLLSFPVLMVPAYFLLKPLYIHIGNPGFVIGYLVISTICLLLLNTWNESKLHDMLMNIDPSSFVFDLDPMELKYMESQELAKSINGRLNQMLVVGKVAIENKDKFYLIKNLQPANLEEWEVHQAFEKFGENATYATMIRELEYAPIFNNIINCMDALKKYITKSKQFGTIFYTNFVTLGLLLLIGFTRLATGIMRDKPIMIILVLLMILLLISGAHLFRLAKAMVTIVIPVYYKKNVAPKYASADDWAWQYVLYDATVLSPALASFDSGNRGSWNDWGSSGSCGTSSDSSFGSSCGSSCGGCGGGD